MLNTSRDMEMNSRISDKLSSFANKYGNPTVEY